MTMVKIDMHSMGKISGGSWGDDIDPSIIMNAKKANYTMEQFMMINKDPKLKSAIVRYWNTISV